MWMWMLDGMVVPGPGQRGFHILCRAEGPIKPGLGCQPVPSLCGNISSSKSWVFSQSPEMPRPALVY